MRSRAMGVIRVRTLRVGVIGVRRCCMMQLIDMVALAGAPKDEQPGSQREAGLAKKRSHKPGTVSADSCGAQEQRATLRIESPFRRITVSRSGSNFQKYRVE